MSRLALRIWLLALTCVANACGGSPSESEDAVHTAPLINQIDNRSAPDAAADPAFAAYARSAVAALVPSAFVGTDVGGAPVLFGSPLYARHELSFEVELCRDERFALEPTPASCSATLIAHDLVLTAGHCVTSAAACAGTAVVFGFEANAAGEVQPLDAHDVYACQAIVARNTSGSAQPDFAVLRLDRSVVGRQPARIARDERSLPLGTPLVSAGHPLGLPLKVTSGGATTVLPTSYSQQEPRYFAASLDAFTGSSGSGAFLAQSSTGYALTGIVSGTPFADDFVYDLARNCDRYERRSITTLWLTYAHQAIAPLCAAVDAGSYPELCACGDAVCDEGADEDGTVCGSDCDDLCGDGACLGDETPASCDADCGTCGDGVCGASEACCVDCGCAAGFACDQALCVPELATAGADCTQPVVIEPLGTQTIHTPSGAAACYAFTLSETRRVRWQGNASANAPICTTVPCGSTATYGPSLTLEPGTYYMPLPGDNARPRSYVVMFDDGEALDGLTCDSAIPVTPVPEVLLSGTTEGGFRSPACAVDQTYSCYGPDTHYTFTLETETLVSATATGFEHITLVLRSGLCTGGTPVELDIDRAGLGEASLRRILPAGVYRLSVDSEQPFDRGAFELAMSFTPPVADGDDCSEPIELTPSGAYSVAGDTTDAANDNIYGSSYECVVTPYGNDHYYAFTLTEPTRIEASVDAAHASALFLNEGACEAGHDLRCERGVTGLSRVLNPGRYMLIVDGNEHFDAGPYTLNLEFTIAPPSLGESCEDAIEIPATGQQRVMGDVYTAANDVDSRCTSQTRGDHAYTFTLTEPRTVHFHAVGSARLYVSLHTDCVAADYNMCLPTSALGSDENRLLAAGTYFLVVDADRYATAGAYDIEIDFESEPMGTSCADTLAFAIGATETTQSAPPGIVYAGGSRTSYGFTLDAPSRLSLSTGPPGRLQVSSAGGYVQANSGALDVNVPAGAYCVTVHGAADAQELELAAFAIPLTEPDGRSCSDAIPVAAPGDYEIEGYTSFGRGSFNCESEASQLYTFELTERTRMRAVVPDGWVLAVYTDRTCTDLQYCTQGTGLIGIEENLDPGQYTLAVSSSSPLYPYMLSLELDCDTDDDGVCDAGDACWLNPDKIEPGACGCALPETDRDADGTPNCMDGCWQDPLKTSPGACGCGVSDADADADGFANCVDACPSEPGDGAPCPALPPDAGVVNPPDATVVDPPDATVVDVPDATVVDMDADSGVDPESLRDAAVDAGPVAADASTGNDAQVEPPTDGGDPVLNDPLDDASMPEAGAMAMPEGPDDDAMTRARSKGCACSIAQRSDEPSRLSLLGLGLFALVLAARLLRRRP